MARQSNTKRTASRRRDEMTAAPSGRLLQVEALAPVAAGRGGTVYHRGASGHKRPPAVRPNGASAHRRRRPADEPTDSPAVQIEGSLRQLLDIVESGHRPTDVLRANTVAIAEPAAWGAADVRRLRD